MPARGKRQIRNCLHCDSQVLEKITGGRFRGYLQTCQEHFNLHRKPGPDHPNAKKAGRHVTQHGYVMVLDPLKQGVKTGSRYIAEHRLVMGNHLGRRLLREEVVHHLNGIRDDNRIENLALLGPNDTHESRTLIKALQKRIQELEQYLARGA